MKEKSVQNVQPLRSVQAVQPPPVLPRGAGKVELGASKTDGASAVERNEVIERSKAIELSAAVERN